MESKTERANKKKQIDLFEQLRNQQCINLPTNIPPALMRVKRVCESKYYNRQYFGNAALNRKILLDPDIAFYLTKESIQYLFSPEGQKLTIFRNGDQKQFNLSYCIEHAIKEGLLMIELLPNNDESYSLEDYEHQKKLFQETAVIIMENIKAAANYSGKTTYETSLEDLYELSIGEQLLKIITTIDLIDPYDCPEKLVKVPSSPPESMKREVHAGFENICKELSIDFKHGDQSFLIIQDLDQFIRRFLTSEQMIFNAQIAHLFLDRAHLETALILNTKIIIGDHSYGFRDILTKIVSTMEESPELVNQYVKEQMHLRVFSVSQDLQIRFKPYWDNDELAIAHLGKEKESQDENKSQITSSAPFNLVNSTHLNCEENKALPSKTNNRNSSKNLLEFGHFGSRECKFKSPYIFNFSKIEAEQYLKIKNVGGSWLIRNSSTQPGLIAVSLFDSARNIVIHGRYGLKEDGWCRFPIELEELKKATEKSNELSLKDNFVSSHAKNLLPLLLESKSQLSIDKLWIPSKNEVILNSKYNAYCLDNSSSESISFSPR